MDNHERMELDEELFTREGNTWSIEATADLPFQPDISTRFCCETANGEFPRTLKFNIVYLQPRATKFWNTLAERLNELIQTQSIPMPEQFEIQQLIFTFEDKQVNHHGKWFLEIELVGKDSPFIAQYEGFDLLQVTNGGSL